MNQGPAMPPAGAGSNAAVRRGHRPTRKDQGMPSDSPDREVTVATDPDAVAPVTIPRPPNNFFDTALIAAIADAFEMLDDDPACRAIVLAAEGKHFCAGAA